MATYVTKRCPHCGFIYQNYQAGEQRKYGCPYKTCARCSKHFWDTDIVEPALHGYENLYEIKQRIIRAIVVIMYTPIALLMLGGGIWLLIEGEMMGLFAIAIGAVIMWMIGSGVKQRIDDKRHWDDIIKNRQIEYDKSRERLKDTKYLIALADYDKRAENLLYERVNGQREHYANRPAMKSQLK